MPSPSAGAEGIPEIDVDLGEHYYDGKLELEEKYTEEIIGVIRQAIDERFKKGDRPARRDAHAFDTGCVRAIFRINPDLSSDLRHGAFVSGREYKAWIRFSNGNFVRTTPWSPDARGMAIKLMGVPGPKILNDEEHTQDFILISHPRFFVDDLKKYKATLDRFLKGDIWNQWLRAPLKLRSLRALGIAFRVNWRFISNPLLIQYWSMTPYRLGVDPLHKIAVKYTAKPVEKEKRSFTDRIKPYFSLKFLPKKEMNDTLMHSEMRFKFYIQRYVDERTPIEDSTVEWLETVSRAEPVAEIIIPSQNIMSADQGRFCEHLSFNPWHCLPEHKPLGVVNRVRRRIYLSISEQRHTLNGAPREEPTGAESFDVP